MAEITAGLPAFHLFFFGAAKSGLSDAATRYFPLDVSMAAMNFATIIGAQLQDRSMRAKPQNRELKILAAAALLALLAKPVFAEDTTIGNMTPEQDPKQKELDKAYKDTMDKLPNPKATRDPWGTVRAAAPSKDGKNNPPPNSK